MQKLRELQLGFANAVFDTRLTAHFAPQVRNRGLSGSRRIQIYRNNFHENLGSALADTYPVIRRLVGEAYFRQAARAYVQSFASTSGDIHRYGDCFGEFLGTLPGTADHPYLVDVATLEWAYHQVFHSAVSPGLDPETLHCVPPEKHPFLRFRLQPAVRLLASKFPVMRIWQVNQEGWLGDQKVNLDDRADYVLVTRKSARVVLLPLGAGEHALLEQLNVGVTLADAYARAVEAEPDFDLQVALLRHVTEGTLVEAYIKAVPSDFGSLTRPQRSTSTNTSSSGD